MLRSSVWEALENRRLLSVFMVTNTGDSGAGSLRQAITDSNSTPGHDAIDFSIGSGGIAQIQPLSLLPAISDEVTIDGTTQPGYSGSPLIWLDGSKITAIGDGLLIVAGNSSVSGLAITNFHTGAGIHLTTNGGDVIRQNYLGVQPSGSDPPFQFWNIDGVVLDSDSNTIQNNLLSGNDDAGALINSSHNFLVGNRVGTDATGTFAEANNLYGVKIRTGSENTIGGSSASSANIISGNASNGLDIRSAGSVLIQNNFIGLDATGSHPLPNAGDGIFIRSSSNIALEGNVISSNFADGLYIDSSSFVLVQQNTIGTDPTGMIASDSSAQSFGNSGSGVDLVGNCLSISVDSNFLSNNAGDGVTLMITSTAADVFIHGNIIGANALLSPTMGNASNGITISSGSATIDSNLIAGNFLDGVDLIDGSAVQNNTISSNALNGVSIFGNGNSISFNTIDHNGGSGVVVFSGVSNSIHANSFFSNALIDIDLNGDGPTVNDAVGHDGPNLFQNYPVLDSATLTNGLITVSGALHSNPSQSFSIDFFQGANYIGSTTVQTDSSGDGSFAATFAAMASSPISTTATDSDGNTSEFSASVAVTIVNAPRATITTLSSSSAASTYGQGVTFTAMVQNATSGMVNFFDGSSLLATVPVDANGQAEFTAGPLSVGTHSFTAAFTGNTDFAASASSPLIQTVTAAVTSTTLANSVSSANSGQTVTFTAMVSSSLVQLPTGMITFMDGTTVLGAVALVNGSASFSTSSLAVGSHSIAALYSGDSCFASSSSSPVNVVVNAVMAATATTLSSSLNPVTHHQPVTFTASVISVQSGIITGTVTFMDGTTVLGTASVMNGLAAFTTSDLSPGTHTITAIYSGDGNFLSSTSGALAQKINTGPANPPSHGPKKAALKLKAKIKANHGRGHAYAKGHDKH